MSLILPSPMLQSILLLVYVLVLLVAVLYIMHQVACEAEDVCSHLITLLCGGVIGAVAHCVHSQAP